jgi:hypothetical protein
MGPDEIYRASRTRLLDLAPTLSEEQQAAHLIPTPPWTVLDGYRHLSGVCCDVLEGNMPGGSPAAGDAWTAAQLAARSSWTIGEVCEQWAERAPQLDDRVRAAGAAMGFVPLDTWTHEQDIRAASGAGALHDDPALPGLLALVRWSMGHYYAGRGGPPLRIVADGDEIVAGDGTPAATLEVGRYELMRIIFGRRSQEQIARAGWSGDRAAEAQAAIALFPVQPVDVVD